MWYIKNMKVNDKMTRQLLLAVSCSDGYYDQVSHALIEYDEAFLQKLERLMDAATRLKDEPDTKGLLSISFSDYTPTFFIFYDDVDADDAALADIEIQVLEVEIEIGRDDDSKYQETKTGYSNMDVTTDPGAYVHWQACDKHSGTMFETYCLTRKDIEWLREQLQPQTTEKKANGA